MEGGSSYSLYVCFVLRDTPGHPQNAEIPFDGSVGFGVGSDQSYKADGVRRFSPATGQRSKLNV
jgi:hypothetical protein